MWESEVMTGSEALMISLTGITIVFLTLVVIALMIKIVSAVVSSIVKEDKKPASSPTSAPKVENKKDGAIVAAIVAAVSEETKLPVDNFRIVSINEKK